MSLTPSERQSVRERAQDCCEYCRMSANAGTISFQIDHITPIKHGGSDTSDNLCLSCAKCNGHKGSNIAGLDPITGLLVRLYHPRLDRWDAHFRLLDDQSIEGISAEGRTSVQVLRMNDADRIETRQLLASVGDYPCPIAQSL